jgi:hypothetical protein
MNEKEPQFKENIDIPRPPEAGREFYDNAENRDKTKRTFSTEAERQAAADKVKEIARITEEPKEGTHNEVPSMPMKTVYGSEKEKAEAATLLISSPPDTSKPGVANELQEKLDQMMNEAA